MIKDELTSKNCLFLICPTDCIEALISINFKGQAFFYTALGACFEWDIKTQKSLVETIAKKNIRQITLVTKMNNTFFMDKIKVKYNLANYSIEEALQDIEDKLPQHFTFWDKLPKLKILATHHLKQEQQKLVNITILGDFISSKNILVNSFLYNDENQKFIKSKTLRQQIIFFEEFSIN